MGDAPKVISRSQYTAGSKAAIQQVQLAIFNEAKVLHTWFDC
jgi:hypothetical protein